MKSAFLYRVVGSCVLLTILHAALVPAARAQFATSQSGYSAGTGTNPKYNDPTAALGEPSRVNPFGDAVTPFNPPYDLTQLVSIGAGGSLTVGFSSPIPNAAANPFGFDFQVFGGAGLIITNAFDAEFNWVGEPATDGGVFGGNEGVTRVSVSEDGAHFYALDPLFAPNVESAFPTDGSGDVRRPVDPALRFSDFAGLTLDGIRRLYAGSGGGTAFDIGWARDAAGVPVVLDSIRYVRIDVLQGKVEVDAVGALGAVPEPATLALFSLGLAAMGFLVRRR